MLVDRLAHHIVDVVVAEFVVGGAVACVRSVDVVHVVVVEFVVGGAVACVRSVELSC